MMMYTTFISWIIFAIILILSTIMVSVIVAASTSWGIGAGNDLPWKLSEDMKHFKNITTGGKGRNAVVMVSTLYLPPRTLYDILIGLIDIIFH